MKTIHKIILVFSVSLLSANTMGQCLVQEMNKNNKEKEQYTYTPTGELIKKETFKEGKSKGFKRFTQDKKGNTVLIEKFNTKGEVIGQENLEYNRKGKLIKLSKTEKGKLIEENSFEYKKNSLYEHVQRKRNKKGIFKTKVIRYSWENGNIVKCETFKKDDELLDKRKTKTYTYDDKPNPFYGNGISVKYLSKNNIETKVELNRFEKEDKKDSYTSEIKYNPQGYPIEIIHNYKSGKQTKKEFKYNCK